MEPVLQKVEKYGYTVERIDIDKQPRTAKRYGVTAVPTYIIVRDQTPIQRFVGKVKLKVLLRSLGAG
jgi:thioredoxin-like negative regulator of GroEL